MTLKQILYLITLLLFSSLSSSVQALNVAVISDIHLNPYYNPYISAKQYCGSTSIRQRSNFTDESESVYAPLGRLYCDPPLNLLVGILERLNMSETAVDVLFMNGDFIGHKIAIEPNAEDQPELYDLMKELFKEISFQVAKYLPNAIVIPTLGNNDYKYHYQSPYEGIKEEYYSYMFTQWFENQPVNAQLDEVETIRETFMNGGYYRIDLDDDVSVLALNTLPYNSLNDPSRQGAQLQDQFEWIETQLKESSLNQKFIISNHIYPGNQYTSSGIWAQWHQNYTEKFASILRKYHYKIMIELSGHDHIADLRYNLARSSFDPKFLSSTVIEENEQQQFHNIFINPSISLSAGQNPGYSYFTIDESVPKDLRLVFLPIEETYNWITIPDLAQWPFREVDLKDEFGLEDLTIESIDKLRKQFESNIDDLLNYFILKIGYDPTNAIESQKALDYYINDLNLLRADNSTLTYFCQMHSSLIKDDFEKCLNGGA